MTRNVTLLLALAAAALAVAACGKRGNPQAPLRPVPVAVADFAIERIGDTATLRFKIPDANRDGSSPPRVDGVEIYAMTQPSSAPAPVAAQLGVDAYRIATIDVRPFGKPPADANDKRPAPGDPASFIEKVPETAAAGTPTTRFFLAVGKIGNRRGPASAVLALPLTALPDPPAAVKTDFTEKEVRLTWPSDSSDDRFIVEEIEAKSGDARRLTAEPLSTAEYTVPAEFGRERCFAVRRARVGSGVISIGPASPTACVTPVDRFPPAAPTQLVASAIEGVVDLAWTASSSADVAGYVVLRAEGADGTLQPLTTTVVTATSYKDQTARPGVTYSYAVIAVDAATPRNESEQSNRYVVTARGF